MAGEAHGPNSVEAEGQTHGGATTAAANGRGAAAPAVIIRQSEEELAQAFGDEAGFLENLITFEEAPLRLELFQRAFLNNPTRMRWVTKARQVGFSFIIALEALARCHLRDNYTAHIVSFSQAEAKEKILLARQAFESLPLGVQKKLVTDSKTELGFEGQRGGISRILVHPSKAPRGRKGDIYLDELAHYVGDREVYAGSTPLILRSGGQLTGCSTPLGRRGIFWEIATQELRKYPHHSRQAVPWYLASFFCKDVFAAAREAPFLPTIEAVARFGTEALLQQFEGLALEDFEQEFGNRFVDTSFAFLPYELILPCTADLELSDEPAGLLRPTGRLVAGYDVGRTKDRAVLSVFEEIDGQAICRMLRSFKNTRFDDQEGELRRLLNVVPLARLSIDRTGMGMQLAENLERDFPNVVGEYFSNESKERWATNVKILLQRKALVLPRDRRLVADFHAIQRKVLPSGKVAFDADRTADGHADGFWSVALAVQSEVAPERPRSAIVTVRILGGDGSEFRSDEPRQRPQPPLVARLHDDGALPRREVAPEVRPASSPDANETAAKGGAVRATSKPVPGTPEWYRSMFVDGVYDDDNPPPATIRPRCIDQAPYLVARGEAMPLAHEASDRNGS